MEKYKNDEVFLKIFNHEVTYYKMGIYCVRAMGLGVLFGAALFLFGSDLF